MKPWKIPVIAFLAVAVAFSASAQAKGKPRKVTLMTQTFGENPKPDNFIVRAIEEATNSDIEFLWVPSTSYKDKLTVTLAAGDLPNIMLITDPKQSTFIDACEHGAFWDIEPYLKEFPVFLAKADPVRLDMTRIYGKLYGIYRHRDIGRSGYVVRSDWLKNLGIESPRSVDAFYNMLVKFVNNDPDGNGRKDTFGAVTEKGHSFGPLLAPFGVPNGWWVDAGGSVRNMAESDSMIEGLKFVRRLYSEGLLNKDYLTAPDSGALFRKGNAGVRMGGTVDDLGPSNWTQITANYPNAAYDGIPRLDGPKGSLSFASGGGFNGVYAFPVSSNRSKEDLRFCLALMDRINEAPLINTLVWGIEGTHYRRDGSAAYRDGKAQVDAYARDAYSLQQLYLTNANSFTSNDPSGLRAIELRTYNEMPGHIVTDPTYTFISPTWTQKSGELNQILSDARGQFIVGAIDEAGYKAAVKKFLSSGGAEAEKEYTALYARSRK